MTHAAPRPPYELHLDLEITRRKRFHVIIDADGDDVFKSRLVGECLDWLRSESAEEYRVQTEQAAYSLAMRTLLRK